MALIDFSTMANEILPHVAGCPSSVAESFIRKTVIDLCERAQVWQVRLTPFDLTPGIYSYVLGSPVVPSEVCAPLSMCVARADTGSVHGLSVVTRDVLQAKHPTWPEDGEDGEPSYAVQTNVNTLEIYPIPDTATTYTVSGLVAIRPTIAATQCDDSILTTYRRLITHGALHALMLLPDRKWTDLKLGEYHGKQWTYLLNSARAGRAKGFCNSNLTVKMRPWG